MIRNQKDFFNSHADRWDNEKTVTPEKYRRIVETAKIAREQKILDIGTGTGVLIPYILEITGRDAEIFAIDYADKMIEQFLMKGFPDNVKPLVMDIHKIDFEDNFFDRIMVNSCYPHFEQKGTALKEIFRIMKPGGICTICHPTGNKHVNTVHRNSHKVIANCILESLHELRKSSESSGFTFLKGIDEEDFFLITLTK